MKNIIKGGLTILAAFLIYSALHQLSVSVFIGVNVFTIVVILFGIIEGEIGGAIMGMVSGLVVDSFSLGIFGLSGIANTITGFLAGFISRKLNILPLGRLFVFIGVMGALDLGLWVLLSSVFFSEGFPWGGGFLLVQPVLTAVLGTLGYSLYRKLKARHER
jgi:rod shape-determining protein MreD